jgi:hypothetical protein
MEKNIIISSVGRYKKLLEVYSNDFDIKEIPINREFFSELNSEITSEKSASTKIKEDLIKFNTSPVLYWFTFKEDFNNQKVLREDFEKFYYETKLLEYRQGKEHYKCKPLAFRRALSAFKTIPNDTTSTTLYVGKVKKGFWGRLSTHAGWATSPKTAGLQLKYWYDFDKYPELTLRYIVLDKKLDDFVSILEIDLAKKLNPLIGKK